MNSPESMLADDRFIPATTSPQAYKSFSPLFESVNNIENSSLRRADLSTRDDVFYSRSLEQQDPESSITSNNSYSSSGTALGSPEFSSIFLSIQDLHQEVVAETLGFTQDTKVFQFKKSYTHRPDNNLHIDERLGLKPNICQDSDRISNIILKSKMTKKEKDTQLKTILAKDILQAPGLRNDYYSNLVSWSSCTNRIIVGLGSRVYIWGGDDYIKLVDYDNDELITAISCSPSGVLVLVAFANGKLAVIDQNEDTNEVLCEYHMNNGHCIFCLTWFNDEQLFLAGDDSGKVYTFEIIVDPFGNMEIDEFNNFQCHQQQICGIVLNSKNNELAVGANDNCCTVWDVSCLKAPVLKFVLPHNAAIKALAYCPWATSLLATGGGSKDRKIRFWHTLSGTLLNEFYTDGQITSLIWSRYKKEIVATFGFGGSTKSNLMRVYSYPAMKPIVEVNATCNLRILSAATSPDFCSICVAANDSTIRIYELWKVSSEIASNPSCRAPGAYGSEIIELVEGVDKLGPVIR